MSEHKKTITAISWCSNNPDLFASASADNLLIVWNVAEQRAVARLDNTKGKRMGLNTVPLLLVCSSTAASCGQSELREVNLCCCKNPYTRLEVEEIAERYLVFRKNSETREKNYAKDF